MNPFRGGAPILDSTMPFTPAHVAAVLPLRGRAHLPFAALAIGSMSPDLPYFLPTSAFVPRAVTHSVTGIITWDLLLGLALWLVWQWTTPILYDVAPRPVRSRWQPSTDVDHAWWAVVLALVIGSATHVLWDSLTHAGHFATTVGPLAETYPGPRGSMAGYRYMQYASGAVGLGIVALAGFRQPSSPPAARQQPGTAALAPALVFAGALVAVALRVTTMHDPSDRRALVFATVTSSISGAGIALIVVCLLHAGVDRHFRKNSPQPAV